MSRYTKEQCEDVALILSTPIELRIGRLHAETYSSTVGQLAKDFADLFAADRPPSSHCWTCGSSKEAGFTCTRPDGEHRFGGFDREHFLAACGLEVKELTCPLCGKTSGDGDVHKECADYEQAMADAQGESQENLEAAEALYDHKVREQEHE
ncbi:hypothetical protein LCGC14_1386130 [marine sediment metagenome]|uniref:Uncharacterized protein n=1 Tax=marine sediment metagenome TaxID=412755 RepID=A0A0F9K1E6_9ZZZZ